MPINQTIISDFVTAHLANKRIALLGFGREGVSSYQFLRRYLPDQEMAVLDEKPITELSEPAQTALNDDRLLHFFQIKNEPKVIDQLKDERFDLIIKTPGIPQAKLEQWGLSGIPTTSNTQLLFNLVKELPQIAIIGVTGTKGKSTTAAVIAHVLKNGGFQVWLGGNIGVPPLDYLEKMAEDETTGAATKNAADQKIYLVLELSSHQLSELRRSPHIAVIQHIGSEHLDYYDSIKAYAAAKQPIAAHQTPDDIVIFNADSPTATRLAQTSPGTKHGFSLEGNGECQITDREIVYKSEVVAPTSAVKLIGKHNRNNVLPAVVTAKLLGIPNEKIAQALASFNGLPHRLELVATVDGVRYFNDSLATTPEATLAALENFESEEMPTGRVVLITGGYDRGSDYSELIEKLNQTALRGLILFPTTGGRLLPQLTGQYPKQLVHSMPEAMTAAKSLAQAGDVVLMSPASASFNLFKDYADRGEQFKQAVLT